MDYSMIGLIAGIIGFIGFIPYIIGTIQRRIKPNKATWMIWAVLNIIIAASYYAAGARETVWIAFANAIGISVVALLSLRYGEDGLTTLDKACLVGAGIGLMAWWLTKEPVLAYGIATSVDAIGAIPTMRKAYERPETEKSATWPIFIVANILTLIAIRDWTFVIAFYPVYLFLMSVILSALAWIPRRKSKGMKG